MGEQRAGEQKNESGWYTDDVTITAPDGYLISRHNLLQTTDWADSVVCSTEGENKEFTVYLKNIETGRITDGIVVEGLKIDKTKPISLAIEYKTAAWYEILESIFGFSKDTVEVFFSANDLVSGIGVVEYSVDGGSTFTKLEKSLDTYSTSIPAQYRDEVVLRVTDVAGNVISSEEDEDADNNDKTLVVDDIAPEINAEFSGKYIYNKEDNIYYAGSDAFAITFTVTDANYDLREANPVVKVNDVVQELAWSSGAKSGMAVLALPNEGHYTITADFADRSGNVAKQFSKVVYVDKTAPIRTVTFTDPARIVDIATMKDVNTFDEGDEVVVYYNTDAVAAILITEENFCADDVVVTVNGAAVTMGKWEKTSSGSWKNTVTLTQEGDYNVAISYTDRAQNEMISYQSQRIVIDKTVPVVSVVYENEDVKNTMDGRDYFDKKQTATITIKEHNFRADDVKIIVTAKDAVDADVLTLNADGVVEAFASQGIDRSVWSPYVEGTWHNENDLYELTLVFAEDANYTFDVEYTDLAIHRAVDYEEDAFTVDQTAPVNLTITYSESVREETLDDGVTYAYYDDLVTVTITAEDQTSGVHYFDYSYINAQDVSGVNAQLLNQRIDVAVQDGFVGTATFKIPKDALNEKNQFNGTVNFTAADRSEEKTDLADAKRIVVDNTKPVAVFTYNAPVQDVNDVAFYDGDITGEIEITEANFFSEEVFVTVTKDGEKYDTEVTWKDSSVDKHIGTFAFTEDGHYVVSVAYTDKSGNEMETYTSQRLVLDTAAPVNVNISYEEYGEGESHYPNKFEEIIDKLFNVLYYNTAAKVTITATDMNSGMEGIALNVTKKGSEGATTIKLPESLVIGADGTITGDKGSINVDENDVSYENGVMTVTCRIPAQFRGALDIVAVDMAKNETPYSDTTIVVVDTIAPDRTVTFEPDRMVEIDTMKDVASCAEGDKVVLYFKKDAVATFKITEANFYADGISVQVNGKNVDITDWTNVEDDTWCGTLTLTEEGDYVITASYLDRARNQMIPYESQRIVVDKTAPVITTKYSNSDVKNTIDGRDYLAAQQTVTITIKDHNFRADDVVVKVTGANTDSYEKAGKDRTVWTAYKEGTWRNDNDTYELTLTFADEANYTFDVEYEDLATNKAKDYPADAFTVDKTPPTGLSISYSKSVLETILNAISFGFYNEQMTVTIKAADATSGIHYFVYSYVNASDVSDVNAELINQKIMSNGAGSATFKIPKDALRHNNQFNGTVNFTAYDRSENSASLSDDKRIVVDNISPEVTVKYNASVKTGEDITYYDDEIACTIEIDEANFYSEDVKVTVTKDGKEFDVTVAWTKESADRNTGIFTLKQDGEYTISVEYTDKSGNKTVKYVSKKHILDTTHPEINVSNIKANSANKDEEYGFVIDIHDINLDIESMKPILTAVVKDENGIYTVKEIELGDPVEVEKEERYTYTVQNLPEDALYTLTCTVMDMAENETIEMLLEDGEAYEEVAFSINRNGSTFAYGNEFTEKMVEQYYVYSVNEDVVIVEVNVDPIENYVIKLNGEELTEGVDYITTQTSNEGEWSRRVYYIDKDLFRAEGEYNIIVSTVDKAETTAYSDIKNLTVAFVVDQTKPVITITGLETGGRYQTDEQTVVLIPTDEGGRLNRLCIVVLDAEGNPLVNKLGEDISVRFEMSGDEFLKYLEENEGKIIFTIPEGLNNQVQIICNDCAVDANNQTNEYNELFDRVTVSQNKLVIFYANKPLFYGSVAGVLSLISLVIFALVKRKKKGEDQ